MRSPTLTPKPWPAASGSRTTKGLLVTDVTAGSDAERKGLQAGDLILEVNREKVATEEDWNADRGQEAIRRAPCSSSSGAKTTARAQDFIVTVRIP